MRFALLASRFNEEVTQGLLRGAIAYLEEKGVRSNAADTFYAPGAFEIPLLAQELAKTRQYDGIICLGCVIKGDTAHFEYISLGTSVGLMQAMLQTEVPITFGILTTYTDEQALKRSQNNSDNKGREAAAACYEAVETVRKIRAINK